MLPKKSNYLNKLVLLVIVTLGLTLTANAKETIDLKLINHTDYVLSLKDIQGIDLTPPAGYAPVEKKLTSTSVGILHIQPGQEKKEEWRTFAPGINKITSAYISTPTQWESSKFDYEQTKANLIFTSPNASIFSTQKIASKPITISQDFVGKKQEIEFSDGGKTVKINVVVESEDYIWEGNSWVPGSWNEKYYDYTITVTQEKSTQQK